jgi:L-ectoine synthase
MTVRIVRKQDLVGTTRHVRNETYETFRFLLASDHAEVTVTDIVLASGIEATYGYDQHIEIAYCLDGVAELCDEGSGAKHEILPGTLRVASRGSRFRFRASSPTRLICVFSPPLTGHETGFAGDQ